jgi:hypothetical protein
MNRKCATKARKRLQNIIEEINGDTMSKVLGMNTIYVVKRAVVQKMKVMMKYHLPTY